MNLKLIIVIVSAVLYSLHFILIPVLRSITLKKAGKQILDLKKTNTLLSVVFYVLVVAFLVLIALRNFSVLYTCILCLCGLLGSFIWTKEEALKGISGVYENCLIYGSIIIYFNDDLFFPVLQLTEEEQSHFPQNELKVVTKSKGTQTVVFTDENVCKQIITVLTDLGVIIKK